MSSPALATRPRDRRAARSTSTHAATRPTQKATPTAGWPGATVRRRPVGAAGWQVQGEATMVSTPPQQDVDGHHGGHRHDPRDQSRSGGSMKAARPPTPGHEGHGRHDARSYPMGAHWCHRVTTSGLCFRGAALLLEPALQSVEPPIPPGLHVGQPGGRVTEARSRHPVANLSTAALTDDQAGVGQGGDVLGHGLARHGVVLGQRGRRQWPFGGQLIEQSPSGRVGQGGKDTVGIPAGGGRRISGCQSPRAPWPGSTPRPIGRPMLSSSPGPRTPGPLSTRRAAPSPAGVR